MLILTLEAADAIAPCTVPSRSQTAQLQLLRKPEVDAGNDAQICEDADSYDHRLSDCNTNYCWM